LTTRKRKDWRFSLCCTTRSDLSKELGGCRNCALWFRFCTLASQFVVCEYLPDCYKTFFAQPARPWDAFHKLFLLQIIEHFLGNWHASRVGYVVLIDFEEPLAHVSVVNPVLYHGTIVHQLERYC
jgi:hypothetical protein